MVGDVSTAVSVAVQDIVDESRMVLRGLSQSPEPSFQLSQ